MSYVLRFVPAFLFCTILSLAQSDLSTITGVVKDPSGSAVPNAKLVVRNEATGVERKTISSESGTFSVTNLPSGFYTVTVENQAASRNSSPPAINSTPACPLAVDVTLEVGTMTETVNVTATSLAHPVRDGHRGRAGGRSANQEHDAERAQPGAAGRAQAGRAVERFARELQLQPDRRRLLHERLARPNDNVFFYDGAVATRTRVQRHLDRRRRRGRHPGSADPLGQLRRRVRTLRRRPGPRGHQERRPRLPRPRPSNSSATAPWTPTPGRATSPRSPSRTPCRSR